MNLRTTKALRLGGIAAACLALVAIPYALTAALSDHRAPAPAPPGFVQHDNSDTTAVVESTLGGVVSALDQIGVHLLDR